jgi:LacI family repressor for deo operon, udp, cdd, tsx, nupC, and nupG
MQRGATLKDVAKLAGVSVATVSRVINGHANVSAETRASVERAILKLNYSPNTIARSLVTGRTGVISLIIVQEDPIVPTTWFYELPIVQSIYDYLKGQDWELQIAMCSYREFQEPAFLPRHFNKRTVDGVLILSAWMVERHIVSELKERNLPHVIIGAHDPDYESLCIEYDNEGAIRSLVEHLWNSGHQIFGLIGGAPYQLHMHGRIQGFASALEEFGLPTWNRLTKYGDWSIESGYELMQEFLAREPNPTAVVCGNDYIAVGAMRAITEQGLRIPEDIAVVGFDDTVVSQIISPTLTTVRLPLAQAGRLAAERLVRELDKPSPDNRRVVLPCEIVIRDSSKSS